jgi:hypothetical protein
MLRSVIGTTICIEKNEPTESDLLKSTYNTKERQAIQKKDNKHEMKT